MNNVYRKLCILGGEPLSQHNILSTLCIIEECKKVYPELEVYIWTGYTYEQLLEMYHSDVGNSILMEILDNITCLVDGPFELEHRDITLKMRGSTNQRIIDVQATLEKGEVVLLYE